MSTQTQNLVFFGPPGAGKGTQAAVYAKGHGLDHISTGDLFRANLKEETPVGLMAKGFMSRGLLVPNEIVCQMVREYLEQQEDQGNGFILDGFPRTRIQAETLEGDLKRMGRPLTGVVVFEVPEGKLLQRLTGRLTCKSCGSTFHVRNHPPAKEGVCDVCGGELHTRADDTEEACKQRLNVYRDETMPCLTFFQEQETPIFTIDADQGIEVVTQALESSLASR